MSVPPESGAFYGFQYSSNHTEHLLELARKCTVKGCPHVIETDSPNKMCESCRSKHRVYASTKRARRKMEKAAISGQTVTLDDQMPGATAWMPEHNDEPTTYTAAFQTEPLSHTNWANTIDPRLFRPSASTSSELAGALTLAPSISKPPEAPRPPPTKKQRTCCEPSITPVLKDVINGDGISDGPARFCSVKGCRTVIAASYPYKMCEPCRDRYRNYGITKRKKWRAERVAFEQELDHLREAEDERRRSIGLPPLADSSDELFKWEQSVVDEKVSMPENIEALISAYASLPPQAPTAIQSASNNTDSLDLIKPLPNLPPHMCTVSHCHKILPGTYMFKRCEQHRLQNRHHSQLKRVREKEVKSVGPPEGSIGETFEHRMSSESGMDEDEEDEEEMPLPKRRKTEKGISDSPEPYVDYEAEYTRDREKSERKNRTYNCTAMNCHNLIAPGTRWRMCDGCRLERKALQAKRRAEADRELEDAERAWQLSTQQSSLQSQVATTIASPSSNEVVADDPMAGSQPVLDQVVDQHSEASPSHDDRKVQVPVPPEAAVTSIPNVEPNHEANHVQLPVYQNPSISTSFTPTISLTTFAEATGTGKPTPFSISISTPSDPPVTRKRQPKKPPPDKKDTSTPTAGGPSSTPAGPSKVLTSAPVIASYPGAYPYPTAHAAYHYPGYYNYMPPYGMSPYSMPPPTTSATTQPQSTGTEARASSQNATPPTQTPHVPYPYPYYPLQQHAYGVPPYSYAPYYPYGVHPYGRYAYSAPPPPVPMPKTAKRKNKKAEESSQSSTPGPSPAKVPEPSNITTVAPSPVIPSSAALGSKNVSSTIPKPSTPLPTATVPVPEPFIPIADRDIFRPSSYSSLMSSPAKPPSPPKQPQYLTDTVAAISKNMAFNYYKPDEKRTRKRRSDFVKGELEHVNNMGASPVESSQSQFTVDLTLQPPVSTPSPFTFMVHIPQMDGATLTPSQFQPVSSLPTPVTPPLREHEVEEEQSEMTKKARTCVSKPCRRTLAVDAVGNICEKCRMRAKKRKENMKQRFNLEPKKSVLSRVESKKVAAA